MIELIYLLHFDEPLSHARHYLGCTTRLGGRLYEHANGTGARITQVLWEQDRHWKVAMIAQRLPNTETLRSIERLAKNQNGLAKYCPICSPRTFVSPKGTQSIDLSLLDTPLTSQRLREA